MTSEDALRFLAHEAARCRTAAYETADPDKFESLCLLHPSLVKAFDLAPMDDYEAAAFRFRLREAIQARTDFREDLMPSGVGCGGPT